MKVNNTAERIKALTSPHFKKLSTGLPNSDIGIGQAGVFIHGTEEQKSDLVSLKIEEGFKAYCQTLEKIQIGLQKKYGNFDVKNVNHLEKLLTSINLPSDQNPKIIADNIHNIMGQIEDLANNIIPNKKPLLNKVVLEYFYIKVGFVLDQLELTAAKYSQVSFIGQGESKLNLVKASEYLSNLVNIEDSDQLKECIKQVIPNAKKVYNHSNDSFEIIPIEHPSSLMGFSTIVYSILEGYIPIGLGVNVILVHHGDFLGQRLYTIDHDYQHASDIMGKTKNNDSVYDYRCSLLEIYNKLKTHKGDETVNDKLSDMLVLFYMTHENPFCFASGFLAKPGYGYKKPIETINGDQHEFEIMNIKSIAISIFEAVGYVVPFAKLYPDFQVLLESKTNFKISNIDNKSTLTIADHLIDQVQVDYLGKLVQFYMAKSMNNFYGKYKDVLDSAGIGPKFSADLRSLEEMSWDLYAREEVDVQEDQLQTADLINQLEIDMTHSINEHEILITGESSVEIIN